MAYNVATDAGKVRLLISDTEVEDPMFTDAEINAFLDLASDNVYGAAALAYGTIIRSRALLAKKISREGYETEEHAVDKLLALKADLETQATTAGGVQVGEWQLSDEHLESFRPDWVDETTAVES